MEPLSTRLMRKPVMLFSGDFRAGTSERGLADGFRRLGWAVHEVDRRNFGFGGRRSLVSRGVTRLMRKGDEAAYRKGVLELCHDLRPDMLFSVKGVGLTRDLLQQARQEGARTSIYYPDLTFNHANVDMESFDQYDLFVTTKSFQVPWLRERLGAGRVAYVPHGYSDAIHQPEVNGVDEQDYRADVLYAGNHSPYKQHWLQQLIDIGPGTDLAIAGNRWREQRPCLQLPAQAFLGELQGVGYCRAIQLARINVAFHFGPTDSDWQDLVSTRTFEIPACGGFMLHIDNEEVREFFEPGREIDVFSTAEELHDKITFYLSRPELRRKMIEQASARSVPAYGYVQRAAQIHHEFVSRQLIEVAGDLKIEA